jgi:hypothetical protein
MESRQKRDECKARVLFWVETSTRREGEMRGYKRSECYQNSSYACMEIK